MVIIYKYYFQGEPVADIVVDIIETAGGKVYIFMILSLHNLLLLVIFKNDISQALRFASITCHHFQTCKKDRRSILSIPVRFVLE